jgi:hypothetical protein
MLMKFSVETNLWIQGITLVELHQIGIKFTLFVGFRLSVMDVLYVVVDSN